MEKLTIDDLIDYLAKAEGKEIHKNKTEKDITAFYGVYRYANPSFKGWNWLDSIAKGEGLANYRVNKTIRKELNSIIEKKYKQAYIELSKVFHRRNMSKMYLDRFPSTKSALTYFSLATNAGISRASKIVQQSLNNMDIKVVVDGSLKKGTARMLDKVEDSEELNKYMLENMQDFYDYLIKKNPTKYSRYKNGWTNRLKALA